MSIFIYSDSPVKLSIEITYILGGNNQHFNPISHGVFLVVLVMWGGGGFRLPCKNIVKHMVGG